MLHMVHPDTFEPIVSRKHREAIVEAFRDRIGEVDDIDRALAEIRSELAEGGKEIDTFYDSDIHRKWDPQRAEVFDQLRRFSELYSDEHLFEDEREYKLDIGRAVGEAIGVAPRPEDWATPVVRAITANLVHHVSGDRFKGFLEAHPDLAYEQLTRLLDEGLPVSERVDEFSDTLRSNAEESIGRPGGHLTIVGALLLAADGDYAPFLLTRVNQVYELVGEAPPTEVTVGERYEDWMRLLDEVSRELADRGRVLQDRLDTQGLLWQMVGVHVPEGNDPAEVSAFRQWRAQRLGDDEAVASPTEEAPGARVSEVHADSTTVAQLASRLHLSESWLGRITSLLKRKRQVIFYGPPGTGKTFVARELAQVVAGDSERVEVVQFHPSYSYEDFIEGFRPSVIEGSIGYSLESGPLKTLAEAARDSDEPHVMLVDEINRANLPKVFGELLYLLEYRDDDVRLQYSHEPFSLPDNLLVIGTMNTADRSIALIDAALRRRFTFVPFFPHEGEIKGLLRRYLEGQERTTGLWVADALDAVNAELRELLGGPHLQIGPSHFMVGEDVELSLDTVEEIWDFSIHPYIEEQLFGREEQIARFTFPRIVEQYGPDDDVLDQVAEPGGDYRVGGEPGAADDGSDASA
ncbi:AAA family ATPase [Nitriliruptoria bacterium AS10]|nr:AAA family ATPase [Salsipaludibacter albus]